ncbi:NPC intracellular cholesterol transporter 2 homolog a-like [Belonocnema kinseyi]|uniref:NPC intracellular cholesterol transporter 2 homolog a-like n=1 Tax=Belonocnema kinseyi TaxID=2817044 RepID=UPI00143D6590|nr:NPC intracellular cholesterol transporter 2 homolog a-like [Belonocnema kinseyi]
MFRFVFAAIFFTLALGGRPPPLKECRSTVGHVVNATVTGCQFRNEKYILTDRANAGIKIYFVANKQVLNFKAVAKVNIGGVLVPYPIPNSDGCSNLKCPLQKGGPYFYQYTLALPKDLRLPKIQINVHMELQDQNNDAIACVIIPVQIH